jgi:hypothetical protein
LRKLKEFNPPFRRKNCNLDRWEQNTRKKAWNIGKKDVWFRNKDWKWKKTTLKLNSWFTTLIKKLRWVASEFFLKKPNSLIVILRIMGLKRNGLKIIFDLIIVSWRKNWASFKQFNFLVKC